VRVRRGREPGIRKMGGAGGYQGPVHATAVCIEGNAVGRGRVLRDVFVGQLGSPAFEGGWLVGSLGGPHTNPSRRASLTGRGVN
jgi:hypothetical protein